MTTARSIIVNREITRYYHVVTRCVRRAHLCGEGKEHRKDWLEARLEELAGLFAIEVCCYSIMDNHLHLLLKLSDGTQERGWSPAEVARRWAKVFPQRHRGEQGADPTAAWVESRAEDVEWVETARNRLSDLGWFMKCLKEPLARMANREDGCTGAFWEGRYRSIGILDEPSLVATCAYIDLNPLAAGLAKFPEDSKHTSVRARVEHAKRIVTSMSAPGLVGDENSVGNHWLCPLGRNPEDGGMVEGLDLGRYMGVVDWMARVERPQKRFMESSAPSVLERIGVAIEPLLRRVESLRTRVREKWIGTVAGEPKSVHAAAMQRGVPWVKNLWGAAV